MDIECVRNATEQDSTHSKVIEFIQPNNWTTLEKTEEISLGININALHAFLNYVTSSLCHKKLIFYSEETELSYPVN